MIVYVVFYDHDAQVEGVFATRELAEEYLATLTYAGHCWIDEHEVQMPCEHAWIDIRNRVVESGEMCSKCGQIRAGNAVTNGSRAA